MHPSNASLVVPNARIYKHSWYGRTPSSVFFDTPMEDDFVSTILENANEAQALSIC
jgi:hypothetical protein